MFGLRGLYHQPKVLTTDPRHRSGGLGRWTKANSSETTTSTWSITQRPQSLARNPERPPRAYPIISAGRKSSPKDCSELLIAHSGFKNEIFWFSLSFAIVLEKDHRSANGLRTATQNVFDWNIRSIEFSRACSELLEAHSGPRNRRTSGFAVIRYC